MPINEKGYMRLTYDELLQNRIAQAQELFGEDIDTTDASPLGKFIRLAAQDLADAYEAQEIIYYARFPNTASGQSLDRLMPFAGITRNPPTRAEHEITFKGTPNYTIENGFLVGTTSEEEFYLVNDLTLDSGGNGVGIVQCTELGTIGNVPLGEITEIVNPSADIESIEHTNIETIAEDAETDTALRERFVLAVQGTASGTMSAILGAVMRVANVKSCLIVENNNGVVDSDGRPPHSFEVFVRCPVTADAEVAEAIFSKKPIGIKSHGTTSVEITDAAGGIQIVNFSHVADKPIYIKLTVKKDAHFELDGVNQIKTKLIGYIGSLAGGEDVVLSSMYRYIFEVAGVVDVSSLTLSENGTSYSAANISIDSAEAATLDADDIDITVIDYEDS